MNKTTPAQIISTTPPGCGGGAIRAQRRDAARRSLIASRKVRRRPRREDTRRGRNRERTPIMEQNTRTIVIDLDTEFDGSGLEITDWTGAREFIDRAAESLGYDTCYDISHDPRPEWGGDIAAHDAACDEVRDVVDSDSLIAAGVAQVRS